MAFNEDLLGWAVQDDPNQYRGDFSIKKKVGTVNSLINAIVLTNKANGQHSVYEDNGALEGLGTELYSYDPDENKVDIKSEDDFNATFTGDIELKEINAPHSYIIEGSGNSPVGFASGNAKVKLEESELGTKLIYEVEANVGGKIAQVGSRLIDMTAKKMADIFFGKFSELVSTEENIDKVDFELKSKKQTPNILDQFKKTLSNKIIIYISSVILLGIAVYLII